MLCLEPCFKCLLLALLVVDSGPVLTLSNASHAFLFSLHLLVADARMSGGQHMPVALILTPRLTWTDNRDGLL